MTDANLYGQFEPLIAISGTISMVWWGISTHPVFWGLFLFAFVTHEAVRLTDKHVAA
jgi:hypothetical protein